MPRPTTPSSTSTWRPTLGPRSCSTWRTITNFAWKEKHVISGVEKEVIFTARAPPRPAKVCWYHPGLDGFARLCRQRKGTRKSLNSASHGAGRVMSRTQANKTFEWKKVNAFLKEKGVTLIFRRPR